MSHDNGVALRWSTATSPPSPYLIGWVEYRAQYGMLSTDLTLIRPGALPGQWRLPDAPMPPKVLTQPLAWEGLKRSLRAGEIRIESLDRALGLEQHGDAGAGTDSAA